ncbi:MAG: class I SAM-dependent methyltransferase [Alphaproteobacteria bacterium]|nr:class I SAM-dependent methyltransferase [Alphaproteobacteria bacterium]
MSRRSLQLDDTVHDYLIAVGVRESEAAARLRARTATHPRAQMQISAEQGQLMAFLVRALGVRRAIEVGTFTGYSALRVAEALPADGALLCCDVSTEYTDVGRPFWAEAGVADRITLRIAPAVDTLAALVDAGEAGTWDWVFLDADKTGYAAYVELAHTLLRTGGVVAIDNVLWSGTVADPSVVDDDTVALRTLNAALHGDARWDLSMVPIGDGLTLLRKR